MAAYVIIDARVTNDSAFRTHLEKVPAIVKAHGGRYLVRGGAHEVIRGNWTPDRLVVLEFDSFQQAMEWQNAPDYADLREDLNRFSETNVVVVEGVGRV
jgi:uncharacterized protein (DUF1330 family)